MFPFIKKEDYKGEDTVVCCISVQNSIFFFCNGGLFMLE